MKKRVFIIHRWEGNPNLHWIPWLKTELGKRGHYNAKDGIIEFPELLNIILGL